MKNHFPENRSGAFSLLELLIIICIIAVLAAIAIPKAQAQPYGTNVFQPNFYTPITNYNSLSLASNSVGTAFGPWTNQNITIRQDRGSSWLLQVTTTNNSVGSVVIGFDINVDSVTNHWTGPTNRVFYWSVPLGNANTYTFWTNIDRAYVNNARLIFPSSATNTCLTNFVTINLLEESHANN